jgi:predicted nucleotidyltransferase
VFDPVAFFPGQDRTPREPAWFARALHLPYPDPEGGCIMGREEILERLRKHESALRARGVAHVALFGSRARGDQHPDSDTDIMLVFDTNAKVTVYDYVVIKEEIAEWLDGPVDVVDRDGLKSYVKPAATADAIYAF